MDKTDIIELIGSIISIIIFIVALNIVMDYFKLRDFKKCYDNSFKYKWCEQYKNY